MPSERDPSNEVTYALLVTGRCSADKLDDFTEKVPKRIAKGLGGISVVRTAQLFFGRSANALELYGGGAEQHLSQHVPKQTYMEILHGAGFPPATAGRSWGRLAERYLLRKFGARTGLPDSVIAAASHGYFPVVFEGLKASDLKRYDQAELDMPSLRAFVEHIDERRAALGTDSVIRAIAGPDTGPRTLDAWRVVVGHWQSGTSGEQ